MQHTIMIRILISILLLCTISTIMTTPTSSAISEENQNKSTTTTREEKKKEADAKIEEKKTQAEQKRTEVKEKACQNREKIITNTMERIVSSEQKKLENITTISEKTQTYYTTKKLSLANYEELVGLINEKKTAAENAITAVSSTGSFSCDSTSPRESITTFKENRKVAIEALKSYRDAVKNLVQAVRSSASNKTEKDPS